jgi:hypothetical protein
MSTRIPLKKLLLSLAVFTTAVVVVFLFIGIAMFSIVGPNTVDESDRDYRAMGRFFRSPPMQLMESYVLDGSFSGDVDKVFSVRVSGMDTELLWQQQGVVRGDRLTAELEQAVNFVIGIRENGSLDWFPTLEQIHRDSHYVYPIELVMQGDYPDAVRLIVMRPFDDMAFFIYKKI